VVGNFEYIEGEADGIPIRVYATTGKKDTGKFALEVASDVLRYYDKYFGIKYPYGKLDLSGCRIFPRARWRILAASRSAKCCFRSTRSKDRWT
jgi:aminopeptidase N